MKKLYFLTIALNFFIFCANAQVSITGYSIFAVGVETKLYKKLSAEFRVFTNGILEDANGEVQLFYGFNPRKYHQIKVGVGLNGSIFSLEGNAVQMPVQLLIFPFQDLKRLAFVIEVTPQFLAPDDLSRVC